jgi:hypothetical protein
MSQLEVADNNVTADTERASSAYVPPLQRTEGQPQQRVSQPTRRWRAQSRANSSLGAKFPVMQGKYREFHRLWPRSPESAVETAIIINRLRANSLRGETGN